MTVEALVLRSLDDHETMFYALAELRADLDAVTRLLDQARQNFNSYPMRLGLDLTPRQRDFLNLLLRVARKMPDDDKFTSAVEKVTVS